MSAFLTVTEAAQRLRVSVTTILHQIHTGRLRASNVARGNGAPRWRISEAALAQYLRAQETTAAKARSRARDGVAATVDRLGLDFLQ